MKAETRTPFPDTFVRDHKQTGIMKTIELTQGQVALVDDEDYEYLMQWKWFAKKHRQTFYAARSKKTNGICDRIYMHRIILKTPKNMECDHVDHNGLNNQKHNLRNCTNHQNHMNRISWGNSIYLGVTYDKSRKLYMSKIQKKYKKFYLGRFKTEIAAAMAYDIKAKELFGEFANLNFKD